MTNMNPSDRHAQLERLIDDTLRDLPLRRAPGALQWRVLAAIEHGANRPWWRKPFAHWPLPARIAFCVASAGLIKVAIDTTKWLIIALDRPTLDIHANPVMVGLKTLTTLQSAILSSVPSLWVAGGIAVLATLYITVFGLGAVAYRTLYAAR